MKYAIRVLALVALLAVAAMPMAAEVWPFTSGHYTATFLGVNYNQDANGFGDPMAEVGINLIGPKAMKTIPELLRYEPKFSLDVIVDLAFPIGEYDSSQALNLGQNRWYGRVGAPIVWQMKSG